MEETTFQRVDCRARRGLQWKCLAVVEGMYS